MDPRIADKRPKRLRLIVPVVLAVTVATLAASAMSSIGCGHDSKADANGDGGPDTPVI